jgi:penicillin-binding protein 4B
VERLRRRMFRLLLIYMGLFLLIAGLLYWIQMIKTNAYGSRQVDLVRRSVLQRGETLELDSGRGNFTDRNGIKLTGEPIQALVVFPLRTNNSEAVTLMGSIAEIVGDRNGRLIAWSSNLKQPDIWPSRSDPYRLSEEQIYAIQELAFSGAQVMPYTMRYAADGAARHLLGFVGQHPLRIEALYEKELNQGSIKMNSMIGLAGLEKQFDRYLLPVESMAVTVFGDAAKTPIQGLGTRLTGQTNPYYPLQVTSTIDYTVQRTMESIADQHRLKDGAVVILDAKNGEIVSMISRPQFDPLHVHPESDAWNNRALQAIAPGSVFKTIVAAAALESGHIHPDEQFDCTGSLGKYGFTCWLKQGHGRITFREAFADSCNIAFALALQKVGSEALEKTASQLGFPGRNGWIGDDGFVQLDSEDAGQIFDGKADKSDGGIIAQTAIGQRDVRMSPLQAANLVVTLLQDGEAVQVKAADRILYRTGGLLRAFPMQHLVHDQKYISARTSNLLREWMRDVVEHGTGKSLNQATWKLAGKSGTAQTGFGTVHQWFVGYGPVEKPRYAVAVVVRQVPELARNASLPLFRDVMNALAQFEEESGR